MQDLLKAVQTLRRPRLLIRAARHGLDEYRRERVLPRLLGDAPMAPKEQTLEALLRLESDIEQVRKRNDGSYSVARHLDILIALMAETRIALATMRPSGSVKP